MLHPYQVLKPEYEALLARARVKPEREQEISGIVKKTLLPHTDLYKAIEVKSGVPAAFLMALATREMSGKIDRYLGNGQPLSMRTTIVPKGRGPFSGPDAFVRGALDALAIDGLDKIRDWDMPRACYEGETWNGWGYRNPSINIPTPYLWGGTDIQKRGKYTSDGHFDRVNFDMQPGMVALLLEIFSLAPELSFAAPVEKGEKIADMAKSQALVPDQEPILLQPAPLGHGGGVNVYLLQAKLNAERVAGTPIRVDGIYGRDTTRTVKAYQFTHHLDADGLVGPKTLKSMGFMK